MTKNNFPLTQVHASWQPCLKNALSVMDPHYLENLLAQDNWLPGADRIFSAFSQPLEKVNYLLFGESPYPRAASANGYAFWDAQVKELWSSVGMSKPVNRATSLRNFIKMLFVAEGLLKASEVSQGKIAELDKRRLIQTNEALFTQLLNQGFLLLNTALVLHPGAAKDQVRKDARAWQPFLKEVIYFLLEKRPAVELILFGSIAKVIEKLLPPRPLKKLCVEHPYNYTFITNQAVLDFFRPFHLLREGNHHASHSH